MEPAENNTTVRWFYVIWLLVSCWLFACAVLVNGEYGDGYQTIVNAHYFFGDSPGYYVQRGPLAGLVLWPVQVLVEWFNLNPVDVRPFHFYSALLHTLYLFGCWQLLKRSSGSDFAKLLSFLAAILTVVFFANAPYLSHDIIPGLLFLILIFICDRWLSRPSKLLGMLLLLLGSAVTFIKHICVLFWFALVAYAAISFAFGWDDKRVTLRKLIDLSLLACASAAIYWIGYGLFIAKAMPDVSMVMRPLALVDAVWAHYGDEFASIFSRDLYILNVHNYGIAAMLLVLPGLIFAFRGSDARLRMIAVCWLLSMVVMQMVRFHEVRYLAFFAPLTAILILPVIGVVLRQRALGGILMAVIAIDQYRGLAVAAEQLSSTARIDVTGFIDAPRGKETAFVSKNLSFVYMADSPLRRDPYHGIYHLTSSHMSNLYDGKIKVVDIDDPRDLGTVGIEPGDSVFYSNDTIIRKMPWRADNIPASLDQLLLVSGDAESMQLIRRNDEYVVAGYEGTLVMLIPGAEMGQTMPLIASSGLTVQQVRSLYGDVDRAESLSITGVVVRELCQSDRCQKF